MFFSWKSCVIAASNCLHFLLFYYLYFAYFWNAWPRSEKDTKERTDPGRSQSTGPHQHLRDAGLTSQRWQQEEPSSETHRLTTLWCGAVLPALSAAPNVPSSISSMLISNTKQNATSRAEEGWAAAQHDILTSSWGSIWVLVGETLRLLPWWRGGMGRRGLSLSYLSLCKLCLRWLSLCPVLVIVNVWHFCQCKEQSLKRQNNSCYSDPNFPEADSLSRHTVCATLWCFFFSILFYFYFLFCHQRM